jgi:phosphinothricin acetyltransferase
MSSWTLREARGDDAGEIASIYAPIVRDTATSFELEPPGAAEMAQRIAGALATHPWIVAVQDGAVLGYAYGSKHRARPAYQWCAETSIYVAPAAQRRGVARRLYDALLELLGEQGFHNAYAGITLPNARSVGLHEAMGFLTVGVYPKIGYKHGAWHDVAWLQKALRAHRDEPAPQAPVPWPEFRESAAGRAACARVGLGA